MSECVRVCVRFVCVCVLCAMFKITFIKILAIHVYVYAQCVHVSQRVGVTNLLHSLDIGHSEDLILAKIID